MLLRLPVKKTDIAHALVTEGRYPMKTVSDTLEVSRSHQYLRKAAKGTKRGTEE